MILGVGIDLIEVARIKASYDYPNALLWETRGKNSNKRQHAAFQAMWVVYDHLLPHCRNGNNDLDNIVIGDC